MAPVLEPTQAAWIRPGYALLAPPPGFTRHCGVFQVHAERPVLAVQAEPHHLNSIGIAHGGFLATLADTAYGVILKRELGLATAPVTVSLCIDYLRPAREGEWVEAHVTVHKAGRSLINASCMVSVGERAVLRTSGVFMQSASAAADPRTRDKE